DRGPENLIDIDLDGLDEGGIFLSNADFLTRPMRFTADEAVSWTVALKALAELAQGEAAQAIDSALAKLNAAGAQADLPIALDLALGSAPVRKSLIQAIADLAVVQLSYDRADQQIITPTVEPKRIITSSRFAYLHAWSLEVDDWRIYRLDRIQSVVPVAGLAQDRGEPEPFDDSWLAQRLGAVSVIIEVEEKAAWIIDYWPIQSSQPSAAGIKVELLVADQAWLNSQLLRLGSSVISVEPQEASWEAAAQAKLALGNYPRQSPSEVG
ncbi:MAG: WYL domain-containing protein, partial [Propionibacteriaceae bacterium]|nr:WYL domain-containing protein [Propionibacteriaceae bacterium]